MPRRSTRMKLKYQVDKALTATKRVLEHLQYLDELADDRSDYINEYLPLLVKSLLEWEDGLKLFREGL